MFKCPPNGQSVLVLGLGISGRSAARLLLKKGMRVTGLDRDIRQLMAIVPEMAELVKAGLTIVSEEGQASMSQFDFVVVSPGISPSHPCCKSAIDAGIEVIGEIELACRLMQRKCYGITGTNGKTTVTLLITHVLNQHGMKAKALGNVGVPLTSVVDDEGDHEILVIELSSFQLDTLQSRFLDAGLLLNITPDHLDRYGTIQKYAQSKIHMADCLKPGANFFVEERCFSEFASYFQGRPVLSYGYSSRCFINTDTHQVCVKEKPVFNLPARYQGRISHDVENVMAAYAICQAAGISGEQFVSSLSSFEKPPHRIEFVRTISGVHYYNDSKGTNIDAVYRAIESLDGKIILIAGGVDKGAPYTQWLHFADNKLKFICAIGEAAEKIKNDLSERMPVLLFKSMEDALLYAAQISQSGENVLLSPGCSSYDMFKDYEHRGAEFKRLVEELHGAQKKEDAK